MLVSVLGYAVLFGCGILLSSDRRSIRWRTVIGAGSLQFLFGVLVLYVPAGKAALAQLSELVGAVIAYGDAGIDFVFGALNDGAASTGFIFAFQVLPVIVFFSSLISVLYFLRIMPAIVHVLGGGVRRLLGTSRAESMCATANIFTSASPGFWGSGG